MLCDKTRALFAIGVNCPIAVSIIDVAVVDVVAAEIAAVVGEIVDALDSGVLLLCGVCGECGVFVATVFNCAMATAAAAAAAALFDICVLDNKCW